MERIDKIDNILTKVGFKYITSNTNTDDLSQVYVWQKASRIITIELESEETTVKRVRFYNSKPFDPENQEENIDFWFYYYNNYNVEYNEYSSVNEMFLNERHLIQKNRQIMLPKLKKKWYSNN